MDAAAEDVGQHVLEVHLHVLKVLVADDAELGCALAHVELDHAVVELAFAELLAKLFAGALVALGAGKRELAFLVTLRRGGGRRQKDVEQPLLGVHLGAVFHFFEAFFAHHVDGDFDQVANHGLDVAAHVAHLGKLRCFHLEEGRTGQLGEAARNFSFAHAGWPNHDDVLGHDVVGDVGGQFLAALAVAQSDGNGALGGALTDDVLVEFGDNFARRHLVEREILFFGGCGKVNGHFSSGSILVMLVRFERARLQPCRKKLITRLGFSPVGALTTRRALLSTS